MRPYQINFVHQIKLNFWTFLPWLEDNANFNNSPSCGIVYPGSVYSYDNTTSNTTNTSNENNNSTFTGGILKKVKHLPNNIDDEQIKKEETNLDMGSGFMELEKYTGTKTHLGGKKAPKYKIKNWTKGGTVERIWETLQILNGVALLAIMLLAMIGIVQALAGKQRKTCTQTPIHNSPTMELEDPIHTE